MNSAALPIEAVLSAAVRPLPGSAVVAASNMQAPPPPATIPTGAGQIDSLTSGIPRGCLTEIFGPASSGRTSLLLSLLGQVTDRGEVCALIDATDSFDPASAQSAGVDLKRVLWVRCGKSSSSFLVPRQKALEDSFEKRETRNAIDRGVENALKVADFLLQAGGFGLIVMDLAGVPPQTARRVPLTSWFRFRRAVEHTPTALVVIEEEAFAKSAAGLVLKMTSQVARRKPPARALPTHSRLLTATEISVEVVRSVVERKRPARAAVFETRAQWA